MNSRPGRSSESRRAAERRGLLAERIAALMLVLKGYRIVERRWRPPFGEIDLIACRGRRVAFIEVKARSSRALAREAVGARQRQRIERAATYWLSRRPQFGEFELSFDVVLVAPFRPPRHIVDAWRPGDR